MDPNMAYRWECDIVIMVIGYILWYELYYLGDEYCVMVAYGVLKLS